MALAKLEAIDHPLRFAILTSLALRPASTKELAAELDVPLGRLRYQLGRLRKAGLAELKELRPRRGVTERVYFVRPEPISAAEIAHLSTSQRERGIAMILKAVLNDSLKALRSGAFGRRDDFMIARMPAALDGQGWDEAVEIHEEALRRLLRVREESRARLDEAGGDPIAVFSCLLLFEMGPAVPPPN